MHRTLNFLLFFLAYALTVFTFFALVLPVFCSLLGKKFCFVAHSLAIWSSTTVIALFVT